MTDPHIPPGPVTPPLDMNEEPPAPTASVPAPSTVPDPTAPPAGRERRSRSVGWQSRDVLRTAALVIAMYLGVRLLWFANTLVLTIFLAVLFGLAVSAGVDRLGFLRVGRFQIPRGLRAALIVAGFYGLLIGFGTWMAPTLREQGRELRTRVPQAVDQIEQWVNRSSQRGFLGVLLGGANATPTGQSDSAAPQAAASPATTPAAAVAAAARQGAQAGAAAGARRADSATSNEPGPPSATETLRARLGGQMSGVTRYLFPFLSSTLAVVTGLLIVTFLSIYIAADPRLYHSGLMHLFPRRARTRAGEVLSAVAVVLRKWLTTQLIAMVVIGVVTTVALLALDVRAAVALGVLAGLLEFVPTIGPILSSIPAIAMAFLDSPEKAVSVALVYVLIQFAENQLLIPMLMKGGVDLPPAVTIVAQALFTLLFGFLGLMVAVPAMAGIMVAVKMLYVEDVVGDRIAVTHDDDDGDDD